MCVWSANGASRPCGRLVGQDRARGGIAKHEGEAFIGISRVERDVGAAGFQDSEQADDDIDGTAHAQTDEFSPFAAPCRIRWCARRLARSLRSP